MLKSLPKTLFYLTVGYAVLSTVYQNLPYFLPPKEQNQLPLKLQHILTELDRKSGYKPCRVWVKPDSYRKRGATAGYHTCGLVLYMSSYIISHFEEQEIEGILAHEIGHHVNHDARNMILTEVLVYVLVIGLILLALYRTVIINIKPEKSNNPFLLAYLTILLFGILFFSYTVSLFSASVYSLINTTEACADKFAISATGKDAVHQGFIKLIAMEKLTPKEATEDDRVTMEDMWLLPDRWLAIKALSPILPDAHPSVTTRLNYSSKVDSVDAYCRQ